MRDNAGTKLLEIITDLRKLKFTNAKQVGCPDREFRAYWNLTLKRAISVVRKHLREKGTRKKETYTQLEKHYTSLYLEWYALGQRLERMVVQSGTYGKNT